MFLLTIYAQQCPKQMEKGSPKIDIKHGKFRLSIPVAFSSLSLPVAVFTCSSVILAFKYWLKGYESCCISTSIVFFRSTILARKPLFFSAGQLLPETRELKSVFHFSKTPSIPKSNDQFPTPVLSSFFFYFFGPRLFIIFQNIWGLLVCRC